jgi:hypothetical protein
MDHDYWNSGGKWWADKLSAMFITANDGWWVRENTTVV